MPLMFDILGLFKARKVRRDRLPLRLGSAVGVRVHVTSVG
jgi:hypothetical protein